MADRIQFRRDTAVNWYAYNPILLEGEVAYDLDGDQYKVGDGEHAWRDLPYRGLPCVQQKGDSTTTPMSQKAVTDELNNLNERLTPIEEVEIGEYIDSSEFVRLYTIKETNQILWGIQKDGNVFYGAGVPRQLIDYINRKINDLSLDEYEDIVAFLGNLIEGDKILQELLDEKVDKEEGKSLIDENYASGVSYIENPEFVKVYFDANGRIIEAIKADGTKMFGSGVVINGNLKVNGDIEQIGCVISVINNPEFIEIKTDISGRIIYAIQKDGNVIFGAGVPRQIQSAITESLYSMKEYIDKKAGENTLAIEFEDNGDVVSYYGEEGINDVYVEENGDIIVEQIIND